MRLLTTIPQDDLRKVPAAAQAIEAGGFDGIVTMENRHDPSLPLAVAATATERVQLVTGIAIAFARSPMPVANMSWDLQGALRRLRYAERVVARMGRKRNPGLPVRRGTPVPDCASLHPGYLLPSRATRT